MKRAREIAEGVNGGSLDPLVVTRDALERCRQAQARFNALTVIDEAKALAAAGALADRRGEPLPLAGVPLVVKDNIWVGGWRITQGSRYFADFVAPCDATAVARLRAAGAVILAIGTCSEFAAKGNTTTPLYGDTLNPLDTTLTAGGSSGGCSAIVAAGAVPIALGTDGGGSSRRPPSHCGLVGFKPSYGAVPHPHGFAEPFWGLSALSPITRDVADAALMFEVIAGPDPLDPDSRHLAPQRDEPVAGLRLAQHPTLGLDVPVDADVAAAYEAAIDALMAAGLMIDERRRTGHRRKSARRSPPRNSQASRRCTAKPGDAIPSGWTPRSPRRWRPASRCPRRASPKGSRPASASGARRPPSSPPMT